VTRPNKPAILEPVMLTAQDKATIIKEHGASDKDAGSTAVQIALLTARITDLTGHLKEHKKDFHTERGLTMLVGKRRRLLDYLGKTDEKAYKELIKKLKLRR
jgi:small subunit ribosomal protein S15